MDGQPNEQTSRGQVQRLDDPRERQPRLLVHRCYGCLILGLPLMLLFENPFTRIAGVLLCLGFIVSGVFLIANPEDLGREEE